MSALFEEVRWVVVVWEGGTKHVSNEIDTAARCYQLTKAAVIGAGARADATGAQTPWRQISRRQAHAEPPLRERHSKTKADAMKSHCHRVIRAFLAAGY